MLRFLHQLSGVCFYALGLSFFVAWLMMKNLFYAQESAIWLQVSDLPLAFSAIVYGGLSLYLSLQDPEHSSRTLAWMIGAPLTVFFGLILVMNFWS